MIKSILEKNILSNNITSFKSQIKKTSVNSLISILPFLCAWGNLLMLELLDSKLNIENLHNKEHCMRMGLVSDNYTIVNYLYPKNCMDESKILRYYISSGGSNQDIYNLLDKEQYWKYITDSDLKRGIKNGTTVTINYLLNKVSIPLDDYKYLNYDKLYQIENRKKLSLHKYQVNHQYHYLNNNLYLY